MLAKVHFKRLTTEFVQPCLKRANFRKSKLVFWRQDEDCISAIEMIMGDYNTPERYAFTLEAGVCFLSIANEIIKIPRFAFIGPIKTPPNDSSFMVSARIGELSCRGDLWWTLTQNTDIQNIGPELNHSIEKWLLPWLHHQRNISAAINSLREKVKRKDLMSAIFMLAMAKSVDQLEDRDIALKVIMGNPLIRGKDKMDIRNWAQIQSQ